MRAERTGREGEPSAETCISCLALLLLAVANDDVNDHAGDDDDDAGNDSAGNDAIKDTFS